MSAAAVLEVGDRVVVPSVHRLMPAGAVLEVDELSDGTPGERWAELWSPAHKVGLRAHESACERVP